MKKFIWPIILFLAVALDLSWRTNFTLAVIILLSLNQKSNLTLALVLFAGLGKDFFSALPFGLYLLTLTLSVWFNQVLIKYYLTDKSLYSFGLIAVLGTIFYNCLFWLINNLLYLKALSLVSLSWSHTIFFTLGQIIINYLLIYIYYRWFTRHSTRII
ncbi:MAG: hypothetical protein WCW02_02415 [Candidatus Buchananbacteria bacterium]